MARNSVFTLVHLYHIRSLSFSCERCELAVGTRFSYFIWQYHRHLCVFAHFDTAIQDCHVMRSPRSVQMRKIDEFEQIDQRVQPRFFHDLSDRHSIVG